MRIHCDAMLGRLARDLRLLGYDATLAASDEHDDDVLARARADDRVLLTRDRVFAHRAGARGVLLESDDVLAEALEKLGLRPRAEDLLSRCSVCGERLAPAQPADLAQAPPGTTKGARCPGCGQVYWEGSHVAAIRERLSRYIP